MTTVCVYVNASTYRNSCHQCWSEHTGVSFTALFNFRWLWEKGQNKRAYCTLDATIAIFKLLLLFAVMMQMLWQSKVFWDCKRAWHGDDVTIAWLKCMFVCLYLVSKSLRWRISNPTAMWHAY